VLALDNRLIGTAAPFGDVARFFRRKTQQDQVRIANSPRDRVRIEIEALAVARFQGRALVVHDQRMFIMEPKKSSEIPARYGSIDLIHH
jgi:hypothetical protein